MENLFEKAIKKNELLKFALGQDEYFLIDREYGDLRGHWVVDPWCNFILPSILEKGEASIQKFIIQMFEEIILTNSFEIHCVEDLLLYHLSVYYYFISEGRINKDMLTPLNKKFNNILNRYVESISDESSKNLISDTIETIKLRGGLSQ